MYCVYTVVSAPSNCGYTVGQTVCGPCSAPCETTAIYCMGSVVVLRPVDENCRACP